MPKRVDPSTWAANVSPGDIEAWCETILRDPGAVEFLWLMTWVKRTGWTRYSFPPGIEAHRKFTAAVPASNPATTNWELPLAFKADREARTNGLSRN